MLCFPGYSKVHDTVAPKDQQANAQVVLLYPSAGDPKVLEGEGVVFFEPSGHLCCTP